MRTKQPVKEIYDLILLRNNKGAEKTRAIKAFAGSRRKIWERIKKEEIPEKYLSPDGKTYASGSRRTALKCDYLIASKVAFGSKFQKDSLVREAQKDLLFYVFLDRHRRNRGKGKPFFCCVKCTHKLKEILSENIFYYIDNKVWLSEVNSG